MSYLLPKVNFKVTEQIKNQYTTKKHQQSIFEEDQDGWWLSYRLRSLDDYRPRYEGGNKEIKGGSIATLVMTPFKRYGFELTIQDGRSEIVEVLEALIATSETSNPVEFTPIEVRDYVKTTTGFDYTDRQIAIIDHEILGGFAWFEQLDARVGKGLRLVCMEV